MESPSNSLSIPKDSFLQPTFEAPKNQYFTFASRYNRIELAKGFEEKAPSLLVTALSVSKIAPAIFYALEKLASAFQSILNTGASLIQAIYSNLFEREILVLDIKKEETIEQPVEMPAKDVALNVEEPSSPFQTPVTEPTTPDVLTQDDSVDEDLSQPAQPNPDALDDLDEYNDLADINLNLDGPALSPAPSNTKRNLMIGGALTAMALGAAYLLRGYFSGNDTPRNVRIPSNYTYKDYAQILNGQEVQEFCSATTCLSDDLLYSNHLNLSPEEGGALAERLNRGTCPVDEDLLGLYPEELSPAKQAYLDDMYNLASGKTSRDAAINWLNGV